jgi:hypothetical protein
LRRPADAAGRGDSSRADAAVARRAQERQAAPRRAPFPRKGRPLIATTTDKIERLHQTLQQELLDGHGPFRTVEDAQAAVDA